MITYNEQTCCNEAINVNAKEENISLMHTELKTIRKRIDVLKLSLEDVIDVLSGGTITKFKQANNEESVKEGVYVQGIAHVLEPENMTLGDNLTHLEIMVNEAIQRVEEIGNIIGMKPGARYNLQ